MSRVGNKPIPIPSGIQVTVQGSTVRVKGPGGELTESIDPRVRVSVEKSEVLVKRESDEREIRSVHGLTRTHLSNMVDGVSRGFQKILEINGVGFRAQVQGRNIQLSLGYSHPVVFALPAGVDAKIDKQTVITLKGPDKRLIGQVAANLRGIKPPEPYKGKGIKYSDEVVHRKEGKTGK